jgi:sugar phosphate isomerase/epimerase
VFVACNTLCFSKEPLEAALRHIAELEFDKIELSAVEGGSHLQPSEVGENLDAALQRLRQGPSLIPAALGLDFGALLDPNDPVHRKRFDAACRLAKPLTVAVLTIQAAPLGTPFEDEVQRLGVFTSQAMREGLVLSVETHSETLTADPDQAVQLCEAVPGLGLTLDPSHYIQGPNQGRDFDIVYPYVQNVHLRDTGPGPGEFQVRVGQGVIEYGRVINQLLRHGYDRALTISILDQLDSPFDIEVEVRKLKLLLESLI